MKRLSACMALLVFIGTISAFPQQQSQRVSRPGTERLFGRISSWRHSGLVSLTACAERIISFGSENVLVSDDSGRSWKDLSPELAQRTVANIELSDDTITVISPSGIRNQTTNDGLTWTAAPGVRSDDDSTVSAFVKRPKVLHFENAIETITARDTLIVIARPWGANMIYAHPMISRASCVAASYRYVYVGLGRSGIARIDRFEQKFSIEASDTLSGSYVQALSVASDMLYAAVTHKQGEILRRPEYATQWSGIPIELLEDPLQVLCMKATPDGLYVGLREQGLAYIDHTKMLGRPLHLGLAKADVTAVESFGSGLLISSSQRGPVLLPSCNGNVTLTSEMHSHCITLAATGMGTSLVTGCHDGSIHLSNDSGRSWTKISHPAAPSEINRLQHYGDTLYLLTMTGLQRSLDTGRTWTHVHDGLKKFNVKQVARVDSADLIVTSSGVLRLSRSGELRQIELPTTFEFRPFISAAVSCDGVLYGCGYPSLSMSIDGGRSWRCYLSEEMMTTRAVSVIGKHLILATAEGVLYRVDRDALRVHLFN
ncbi:MAG: hypothetical protein FGM33_09410 [Candidatus Kapabacteria bacterium]|nr:hypothetical protein [Candidatus Kapabacteria bacterium]